MQCRLDLVQRSRDSGSNHDIQHRLKAARLGFTKELDKLPRAELPHNHVAADVEDAGAVQCSEVNVLEAKVRVSTDGMKKSAVLTPNSNDVGIGGRMGGASAHGGSVHAEKLQVLLDEVAKQVFAHLTDHSYLSSQTPEAGSSVGRTSPGAEQVSINQSQFARRGQRINRAGKDVGN